MDQNDTWINLAGGPVQYSEPQITQFTRGEEITVVVPEPDNTILWVSGVIVPLLIGAIGWYIQVRRSRRLN